MLQNSLLLLDIFEYSEVNATDSVLNQVVELKNNLIAVKSDTNNWGFILFFICFFIIVNIINNKNKIFLSMFSGLYRNKDRHNIFYEPVANETLNKFFLSLQTILLISIILYCYAIHEQFLPPTTTLTQMLLFLGKSSLVLIVFFLYKFLTYSISGAIFFKKETVLQWNGDFFSLISLNGIFLFLPTLLLFYVETAFFFCIYFIIFYLIFNLLFIFYKIYTLFFRRKQHLLYFILYLCTQEIIPLYLVYRVFIYLIAQKDTIWIQV
jgi:hypothetical protein